MLRFRPPFSLAAGGKLPSSDILPPLLIAFTTNTISKFVAAGESGGSRYALRVAAGLLVLAAAMWAPWIAGRLAPLGTAMHTSGRQGTELADSERTWRAE